MILEGRDIFIKNIFSLTAPYVDLLSSAFSFGMDRVWRRRLIAFSEINNKDKVLDVCTGTGELAFLIARKLTTGGSVIGVDFCSEMISLAKRKIQKSDTNISFSLANAKTLPFPDNSFDVVTVSFGMRNIPETILALKEIHRVLKEEGIFLCLELTKPVGFWVLSVYKFYVFKVMPFIANIVLKSSEPYRYLPNSIDAFYPPEEFRRIIMKSGFSDVSIRSMTFGIATMFRGIRHEQDEYFMQ